MFWEEGRVEGRDGRGKEGNKEGREGGKEGRKETRKERTNKGRKEGATKFLFQLLKYCVYLIELCKEIKCPSQGEICVMDKYHRAVCKCPRGCPKNFTGGQVCGTDKVTYPNECEMNMTACVLGDVISVVHKGKCLEKTGKCGKYRVKTGKCMGTNYEDC